MIKIVSLLILIFFTLSLYGEDEHHGHEEHGEDEHHGHEEHGEEEHHGHEEHGGKKAIGKGKSIIEVHDKKGLKLSKEAIKTIELKLKRISGEIFQISKETLVTSKNLKGIYRYRNGFFKFLNVQIINNTNYGYVVKVEGWKYGDQVVISGVGLLRVSDVYSTDKSEYGHAH